ncbi:hypothetical protein BDQ17DRAFT_1249141, partial [Cyathus striatus]
VNRPAQYAINKINAQGYVEMDYFTLQGCSLAKENASATGMDALGLVNINGEIAL